MSMVHALSVREFCSWHLTPVNMRFLLEVYHAYFSGICIGLTFPQLYPSNIIFLAKLFLYIVSTETSVKLQGIIYSSKTEFLLNNL
jgi:hypothetical protein